jgi:hypothetical protein
VEVTGSPSTLRDGVLVCVRCLEEPGGAEAEGEELEMRHDPWALIQSVGVRWKQWSAPNRSQDLSSRQPDSSLLITLALPWALAHGSST